MMHASCGVFCKKGLDWAVCAQRVQEFDFAVGQVNENHRDPMLRHMLDRGDLCTQGCAVLLCRRRQIWNRKGDMVQPANHRCAFLGFAGDPL